MKKALAVALAVFLHIPRVLAEAAPPHAPYALDAQAPGVVSSYYTRRILGFLDHWPPATLFLPDKGRGMILRAIRTPGHANYVGMVKHLEVQAPLEKVVRATEGFEDYPRFWKGIRSVHVESRDANRTVTVWERDRPAFFLPTIRYRLLYVSDKSTPGRVVYRQQLIDGNAVSATDGLIVLEKLSDNTTRVSVLNFFDPDCGPFRSIIEGTIWKKSMENSYKDDISFRAHLEHPDWGPDQIAEEADEALKRHPIDSVEYTDALKFSPGANPR